MVKLLKTSLATAVIWEAVRYITPFEIPARIAPFLVSSIAFGTTFLDDRAQLALSAAGGVAIFHKVTDASTLDPIELPHVSLRRAKGTEGHKIPRL